MLSILATGKKTNRSADDLPNHLEEKLKMALTKIRLAEIIYREMGIVIGKGKEISLIMVFHL